MLVRTITIMEAASIVALLALVAPAVRAHDTCCGHNHTGSEDSNSSNTCVSNDACDEPWEYGTCVDKNTHGYAYCSCQWDPAQADYAMLLVNALTALDGPPAPDTTVSYQTSTGPESFGELVFSGSTVVSFAPSMPGPGGFVSLAFGSFADPTAVPVSVDQWFFEFPPGMIGGSPVGPSSTALAPGTSANLVYDASTNLLSTPPGESMLLTVTNDVHTDAPLRLLWAGDLQLGPDPDVLQVVIQSVPSTPPPAVPAFPNTGAYGLMAALLIVVGGAVRFGNRVASPRAVVAPLVWHAARSGSTSSASRSSPQICPTSSAPRRRPTAPRTART